MIKWFELSEWEIFIWIFLCFVRKCLVLDLSIRNVWDSFISSEDERDWCERELFFFRTEIRWCLAFVSGRKIDFIDCLLERLDRSLANKCFELHRLVKQTSKEFLTALKDSISIARQLSIDFLFYKQIKNSFSVDQKKKILFFYEIERADMFYWLMRQKLICDRQYELFYE